MYLSYVSLKYGGNCATPIIEHPCCCACFIVGWVGDGLAIKRYMKGSKKKEVALSQEQENEILLAFQLLDREDEGSIESRELKLFFIALGFQLKKE
jgi:hypothetical protein